MTFLEVKVKTELEYNVCDNIIVKEKCNIWYRAERYSLIIILSSALF